MLESFFEAPFTLDRLRSGPSGEYLDGFSEELLKAGYSRTIGRRYLRSASHVGWFVETVGELSTATITTVRAYAQHFDQCQCPHGYRGKRREAVRGATLFFRYLSRIDVATGWDEVGETKEAPLVVSFRSWSLQHKGLCKSTLGQYCRGAGDLLRALGDAPARYTARDLRSYISKRSRECSPGAMKNLIPGARAFLRYLAAVGACRADLDRAIPAVAIWRHASQPHSLGMKDVDRTLGACDTRTAVGLRDRAVILMLARLGLRAGDVSRLQFSDVDWDEGSLLVAGKSRREVRLPLPQEVGDALLGYIESRPSSVEKRVFLRVLPPYHALVARSISAIVERAMRRAGVIAPSYGSHILRHTAATEMLRQGASLYEVGAVLRHRSYDQTARYAKVDVSLLKLVAQPWPEVL